MAELIAHRYSALIGYELEASDEDVEASSVVDRKSVV